MNMWALKGEYICKPTSATYDHLLSCMLFYLPLKLSSQNMINENLEWCLIYRSVKSWRRHLETAFLGLFAKLRKVTCHGIWYFGIFSKVCWENWSSIKTWQEWILYMKTGVHLWLSVAHFFLEWVMFLTKVVENIKKRIFSSVTFFFKFCRLVWKNMVRAGQATNDNMAHACCMLNEWGYKHTLGICNSYCFSMATVFAWRLQLCLYMRCLSCLKKDRLFLDVHIVDVTVCVMLQICRRLI